MNTLHMLGRSIWNGMAALGGLIVLAASLQGERPIAHAPQRDRWGVNPGTGAFYTGVCPYADLMKTAQKWRRAGSEEDWNQLNARGYPVLEEGESAYIVVAGEDHPSGEFVLEWEGDAEVSLGVRYGWDGQPSSGWPQLLEEGEGRKVYRIEDMKDFLIVEVTQGSADQPLRRLRLWLPGLADSKPKWNPEYAEELAQFGAIRFMGLAATNGSPIANWEGRASGEDIPFRARGAPIEWMIELANETQTSPWICMPHQADDDYVRRYAELVRSSLHPELVIYIEYSNEVFNRAFDQFHFAVARAKALNLGQAGDSDDALAARYSARRTNRIIQIWKEVFAEDAERIRGVATFIARDEAKAELARLYGDLTAQHVYAYATAPYPGVGVGELLGKPMSEATVEDLLQVLFVDQLNFIRDQLCRAKEIADAHGKPLLAYEGGQHLSAFGGKLDEQDLERFGELATAAQVHPRMGEFYQLHLNDWISAGGDLYMHFTWFGNVEGQYAFGMKPDPYSETDDYIKAKTAMDFLWAKRLPRPMWICEPEKPER